MSAVLAALSSPRPPRAPDPRPHRARPDPRRRCARWPRCRPATSTQPGPNADEALRHEPGDAQAAAVRAVVAYKTAISHLHRTFIGVIEDASESTATTTGQATSTR
jgi:hypothetical protein